MILNMTITGTSSTKSIMIISIDSGSTVAVYSDAACTTLVKNAVEKSSGEFWITDLNNGTYYIKAILNEDTAIISYTISEYGVYRIVMTYSTIPTFSYSGTYAVVEDDDTPISNPSSYRGANWKIRFLTSGTLNISALSTAKDGVDIFLVGGGGGGGYGGGINTNNARSGGGGGYTKSVAQISLTEGIDYPVAIGAGGDAGITDTCGGDGGSSSIFGETANGGRGGRSSSNAPTNFSNGGSGGGQGITGSGGTDGGNGANSTTSSGLGQGTSTREFYEIDANTSATLYSSGGRSINQSPSSSGDDNTGDGGDGVPNTLSITAGNGGSGIVIIRNARS